MKDEHITGVDYCTVKSANICHELWIDSKPFAVGESDLYTFEVRNYNWRWHMLISGWGHCRPN